MDLNHRPLGYEPNELPDCSTPHSDSSAGPLGRQTALAILMAGFVQNQHFHAAVFGSAVLGIVGIPWAVGAKALNGKAGLRDSELAAQQRQQIQAAGGGELPIVVEAIVVDGHCVGMTNQ